MHALLAVTELHMCYLRPAHSWSYQSLEMMHWHKTISSYALRLSEPVTARDADSMLATATLINGLAFAMLDDVEEPSKAWPLQDQTTNGDELWWLKLQNGIGLVFGQIMSLTSYDGTCAAFQSLFAEFPKDSFQDEQPQPTSDKMQNIDSLIEDLYELCGATSDGSSKMKPTTSYDSALEMLYTALRLPPTMANIFEVLGFVGNVSPEFVALLELKDHGALLLLCLWYGKLARVTCWWTMRRSQLEHQSIAIYLQRYGDQRILDVLGLARTGLCQAKQTKHGAEHMQSNGGSTACIESCLT